MTNNLPTALLQSGATVDDFVAALRHFNGLAYSEVTRIDGNADGRPQGSTNCTGLIFLALIRVELLPANFDPNVSSLAPGFQQARYFRQLLTSNMTQVETQCPGAIILQRWHDVQANLREPHHVAVCTAMEPAPFGSIIHALDRNSGGLGCVAEVPLDAMEAARIDEIWTLNALGGS